MPPRKRSVITVAQMGASAGTPAHAPATPDDPPPPAATLPAVPATPPPGMSEIASNHASNNGHRQPAAPEGLTFRAADLVRGLPVADSDLVTVTLRLPRVLAEALDIEARMTRAPKQTLVARALWAQANRELIDSIHHQLYGSPYPAPRTSR